MIDYEFKIKLLDKEITHLREMQQLMRERQDTADTRLEHIETILKSAAQGIQDLASLQVATELKLQALLDALLHSQENGH